MRIALSLAATLGFSVLAVASATQTKLEVRGLQDHPFTTDFASGGRLRMHLRSGDFHIVGKDENKITVTVGGRNAYLCGDMRVRLEGSGNTADLTISGGPKNDLQVTVEVPRKTGLFVRMPAGDLRVHNLVGDKDVELHAGDMTIEVGEASDYSRVDASVYTGDLQASPFGESHSGLFRSFHKEGNGRYFLHAHVGAGDLTLR